MISKRNSRRATIGDVVFRYKVSATPKSKGIYQLNFTAQREAHQGSRLVVVGLIQKDAWTKPAANWEEHIYYPTVTRHEAAWFIQEAIAGGWEHSSKGRDFILEVTNEIFRVGGVLYVSPETQGQGSSSS
ncbi:MAG TPA: hypothetical protein VGE67_06820 [Haloferula sp.]